MFCVCRVDQAPLERTGHTVHMQIICTAYAQHVWQIWDSLHIVRACYTIYLPCVQSTYPEFLGVQQPGYLKGPMGMWKFWINACSIKISAQQNSQVEEDEMSREIGAHGSSLCWKRRGGSCVRVQQPYIYLLIYAALPCLVLIPLSWVPRLWRLQVLCLLCYSDLAWLPVVAHTHASHLIMCRLVVIAACPSVPGRRGSEMQFWVTFSSTVESLLLSPISFSHCQYTQLIPLL